MCRCLSHAQQTSARPDNKIAVASNHGGDACAHKIRRLQPQHLIGVYHDAIHSLNLHVVALIRCVLRRPVQARAPRTRKATAAWLVRNAAMNSVESLSESEERVPLPLPVSDEIDGRHSKSCAVVNELLTIRSLKVWNHHSRRTAKQAAIRPPFDTHPTTSFVQCGARVRKVLQFDCTRWTVCRSLAIAPGPGVSPQEHH
jgi:hypothetical protein